MKKCNEHIKLCLGGRRKTEALNFPFAFDALKFSQADDGNTSFDVDKNLTLMWWRKLVGLCENNS
jgi:hypothetical protein